MYQKSSTFKLFLFLSLISFLISCSSTTYIEGNKSSHGTSDDIDLDYLNESSSNVVEQFLDVVESNSKKKKFLYKLAEYINTPYQYGGETKSGMDCSGFTQTVYKKSLNVDLPRTAREQFKVGEKIGSKSDLKFGDLVYFDTSSLHFPGHVGIFLDKDLFAHASSSRGVIISSLNNTYYANKYIGATRIKVKRKRTKN
ncbi:MAG: C40 family peptidase [Melioribacteraceae bacterium]